MIRSAPTLLLLAAAVAAPGLATAQDKASASGLDVKGWPVNVRQGHREFVTHCGRCHALRLALEKKYAPRTWRKYLVRMMHKEDSELDAASARRIYTFLTFYGRNRAGLHQKPKAAPAADQKTARSSPTPAPTPSDAATTKPSTEPSTEPGSPEGKKHPEE